MSSDRVLHLLRWLSRMAMAGIFFYTGYIKIDQPMQFAAIITGYKLIPPNFAYASDLIYYISTYFPWIEIALGIFLLIGWKIRYAACASATLLMFFMVILSITYARGIQANCGCFSFNDRITPLTIVRDSIILLPALFLLWNPRRKPNSEPAMAASESISELPRP
jgi:putative oxidoreductase